MTKKELEERVRSLELERYSLLVQNENLNKDSLIRQNEHLSQLVKSFAEDKIELNLLRKDKKIFIENVNLINEVKANFLKNQEVFDSDELEKKCFHLERLLKREKEESVRKLQQLESLRKSKQLEKEILKKSQKDDYFKLKKHFENRVSFIVENLRERKLVRNNNVKIIENLKNCSVECLLKEFGDIE